MTLIQVDDVIALVAKLWPRADWPPELQAEFARRLVGLPIDAEQARAALVNLAIGFKWRTIQPSEVLEALNNAARIGRTADNGDDAELKAVADAIDPESPGFEALSLEFISAEPKLARTHWRHVPLWLIQTGETAKWAWGRRFIVWARAHRPDTLARAMKPAPTRATDRSAA